MVNLTTPTINNISTNDYINYKGVQYAVASVVSVTTGQEGINDTAVITITVGGVAVTLHLTDADTVCSAQSIDANGVQHTIWKQTTNA